MNPTTANQLVHEHINGLIRETALRRSHHYQVPRKTANPLQAAQAFRSTDRSHHDGLTVVRTVGRTAVQR